MPAIEECTAATFAAITGSADDLLRSCRPMIVRGACSPWPVVASAASGAAGFLAYIKPFATDRLAEAFVGAPEIGGRYHYGAGGKGFNFERQPMRITEFVERLIATDGEADAPSIYLGSLQTELYLPGFANDNKATILPTPAAPRIWLGSRSTTACHYDVEDNLACVVAGRRRFTLFSPSATANLYSGPIDHTMAGQPVSLAVGSAAGDPRYPLFETVRDDALVGTLEPGDALYLPKLWWHQVEALDSFNVLVNYWWDAFATGRDAPSTALFLALITIAERPPAERESWRAFFDHYAFRPDRHPLAHLPDSAHGILGPLQPENYGKIRAQIMQLLRNA